MFIVKTIEIKKLNMLTSLGIILLVLKISLKI